MKLARLGEIGHEIPVLIDGDRHLDLSGVISDIDATTLALDLPALVAAADLPELAGAAEMRIGAPIARPSAIICIGMNYAAHAAESGSAPPSTPIVFLKTPNTVGGPNDPVDVPRKSEKTDWEVELGVVIGERALYLDSPADSRKHVAGYLVANDLSERTFQIEESGGQWSKGKSAPGFSPLGPWLVTADEVDPSNLRLRSWVNGEPRQDSSTADLIFDVDFLIWHLSQYMALETGDVVLTGTPEGVALSGRFPYISAGDVVEIEIEGLGRQRQVFGQA
ncbi:fumarylacetoacetate hydrolase family protein [Pseudonocardia sp. TRM90224]|uniref:fumarylacetoacetate hydrolase family protein n=1 Tax=Pseudonocardia sp. TRM90224 TaxID=2812678 RepID=UPI001E400D0D|nr:fumarylacetoacetate hydrolase family protein [Pseudonocardia sp. TRM90224]